MYASRQAVDAGNDRLAARVVAAPVTYDDAINTASYFKP